MHGPLMPGFNEKPERQFNAESETNLDSLLLPREISEPLTALEAYIYIERDVKTAKEAIHRIEENLSLVSGGVRSQIEVQIAEYRRQIEMIEAEQ